MKVEAKFSNGKQHITVKTVGQLIDELSRLPRELRVMQEHENGADVVVYNNGRPDCHLALDEAGLWDD